MRSRTYLFGFLILILMSLVFFLPIDLSGNNRELPYDQVEHLIGMSHSNLLEEWQIALHEDMEKQVGEYSSVKLISTNAGSSSFKQISDVNKLMEYGIDLLIIAVDDAVALRGTLDEVSQDIPVILIDRDVDSVEYSMHIGPDYYEIGHQGAKRIVGIAGGEDYRVMTVNGAIEDDEMALMDEGFTETISRHGNVQLAKQVFVDWTDASNREELRTSLSEDDYDAVFVHSTELVLDVIEVFNELDMEKPVVVAGKYLSDKYLTYIDIGDIHTLIHTPVGASEAIEYGMQILNNPLEEQSVPKRATVNSYLIDRESKERARTLEAADMHGRIGMIDTELFDMELLAKALEDEYVVLYETVSDAVENSYVNEQQQWIFSGLLDKTVDMILIEPIQSEGWSDLFGLAEDMGVIILCLGNKSVYDLYEDYENIIYIGSDYMDQGEKLSSYLINEVYSTNYDIGILEVYDMQNEAATNGKSSSLSDQISGYSRINVIAKVGLDADRTDKLFAEELKGIFSRFGKDINVIYLHNDMYADMLEDALPDIVGNDLTIISSNDIGILSTNEFIDFQVRTKPMYEEQIMMIVDNYYEEGYVRLDGIFLPNSETEK